MRALGCTAVLVASALAASACGGSHGSSTTIGTGTNAIRLHETGYDALPPPARNYVRSLIASPLDGPIDEIAVYGPGSRAALARASTGDNLFSLPPRQRQKRFYLVVLHGHFVCGECRRPLGARSPHGTIEAHVWSQRSGPLDFAVRNSLPAAMSRLHRLATIQLS